MARILKPLHFQDIWSLLNKMIIRLSQKLGKKIKISPKTIAPPDPNPFADWSAHLFTAERTQYIIFTNTQSLYSVVFYGRGVNSDDKFLDHALSSLREFMVDDGLEFIFRKHVVPTAGKILFSKSLNRSITGSINDYVQCGKYLLVERGLSPFDIALVLNKMPMSYLKSDNANSAFRALDIEGLDRD